MARPVERLRAGRRGRWTGARSPRIAILGAGAGGLCMAMQLRRAGMESFTVYEKSDGVGGTWRDNTYPGAACDAPSHLYSFSFVPRPGWTRRFAPQPEILQYFEDCADRFGLRPNLRLGTEITSMCFDEGASVWRLRTRDGEEVEADMVVSGLGQLNRPAVPDLAGLASFRGTTFHSARWDHDHDLSGEQVAVIGTAASAVQLVPEVAKVARHLDVYQRSPNWVFPRRDRVYSERVKRAFARVPGVRRSYRAWIYWRFELGFLAFRPGSRLARYMERGGLQFLDAAVHDPELRRALEPDYPIGCKRILLADDYYGALQRDNVELVTSPIERIEPDAIVTADGTRHPADTIVLATGFDATHFLAGLEVVGRGGRRLEDAWRDGAEAYRGITVSGFPNLFLLYGPNTNLGHNSIIFMIEQQVHYVMRCIHELRAGGAAALDVRRDVQDAYNRDVQGRLADRVWAAGCSSWYKNAAGKITNNWSGFATQYWLATRRVRRRDFEVLDR